MTTVLILSILCLAMFALTIWGVVQLFMKGYPLLGILALFVPFLFILGFTMDPKPAV